MFSFLTIWRDWLQITFISFYNYFKLSPISTCFFFFLFCVVLLNIIKEAIVRSEKKHLALSESCRYLIIEKSDQSCGLSSRKKDFKNRGNSCEGCKGKVISITKAELEERAANDSLWKRIIILLAKLFQSLLPYMSFFYTLVIAIFEKQKG